MFESQRWLLRTAFLLTAARMRKVTMTILILINLLNYLDRYTIAGKLDIIPCVGIICAGVLPLIQDKSDSGLGENLSDAQGGLLMTVFIIRLVLFCCKDLLAKHPQLYDLLAHFRLLRGPVEPLSPHLHRRPLLVHLYRRRIVCHGTCTADSSLC
jgi:hypothetical protein